jgi:hypothetical protein
VKAKKEDFSPQDVGDEGLDLIAFHSFGDAASNIPITFAQCGCTPTWKTKQHSSGVGAWNNVLAFDAPPQNMMFIPYCLRESSGRWHRQHEVGQVVLIDRLRLVRLLKTHPKKKPAKNSARLIQSVTTSHESIF